MSQALSVDHDLLILLDIHQEQHKNYRRNYYKNAWIHMHQFWNSQLSPISYARQFFAIKIPPIIAAMILNVLLSAPKRRTQ